MPIRIASSVVQAHAARAWDRGALTTGAALVAGTIAVVGQIAVVAMAPGAASASEVLAAAAHALCLGATPVAGSFAVAFVFAWVSIAALVGLLVGVDAWRRAQRALRRRGDLELVIEGRSVTVRAGDEVVHSGAPLVAAQAFPDHVQIVVGVVPRLEQVEVPALGAERAALLDALRGAGLAVGERPGFLVHVVRALVLAPAVLIPVLLAARAVPYLAGAALFEAMGPRLALAALGLGASAGVPLLALRVVSVARRALATRRD